MTTKLNFSSRAIAFAVSRFIKDKKGSKYLPEYHVKELLRELGFQVPKGIFIEKYSEDISLPLNYPLVAKISSAKITSKSDVGGVILGIKNKNELRKAIIRLSTIPSCEGILIEEMAPKGIEVIIGGLIDHQFGPVVMFGIGGFAVELYRDTAFALAPLNKKDALWLIKQVEGYKLIEGYRNSPPADIPMLIDMIIVVSKLISTNMLIEIDLNPVVLYPTGALVLDAKMFI